MLIEAVTLSLPDARQLYPIQKVLTASKIKISTDMLDNPRVSTTITFLMILNEESA